MVSDEAETSCHASPRDSPGRQCEAPPPSQRAAVTVKGRLHYKRLLKPRRMEGLWHWRQVALALHEAGERIHSGTQPTERLWAALQNFFPRMCRTISKPWFDFLAALAFLRYNWMHWNKTSLPV